jgi:hypothetical protein
MPTTLPVRRTNRRFASPADKAYVAAAFLCAVAATWIAFAYLI